MQKQNSTDDTRAHYSGFSYLIRRNLGLEFKCYMAVEAVWHTCIFAACLRFKPTGLLVKHGAFTTLFGALASKMMLHSGSAGWKRALAEWFVVNKFVGLPLWPAKIGMGAVLASHLRDIH